MKSAGWRNSRCHDYWVTMLGSKASYIIHSDSLRWDSALSSLCVTLRGHPTRTAIVSQLIAFSNIIGDESVNAKETSQAFGVSYHQDMGFGARLWARMKDESQRATQSFISLAQITYKLCGEELFTRNNKTHIRACLMSDKDPWFS